MTSKLLAAMLFALVTLATCCESSQAFYHPKMGRFVNRDPGGSVAGPIGASRGPAGRGFVARDSNDAGYADGYNLYQYIHGMPLVALDPYGLKTTIKKPCGTFIWSNRPKGKIPGWSLDFDPKGCGCKGRIKLVQVLQWDTGTGSHAHFDIQKPGDGKWTPKNDVSARKFPGYCESGFNKKEKEKSAYKQVGKKILDAPYWEGHEGEYEYGVTTCAVCVSANGNESILGCINFRFDVPGTFSSLDGFYQYDGEDYTEDKNGDVVNWKGKGNRIPSGQPNDAWDEACECWKNGKSIWDKGHRAWYKDRLRRAQKF